MCTGHQKITEDLSRRTNLLVIGYNVPSLRVQELNEVWSRQLTFEKNCDKSFCLAYVLVLEDGS